MSTALDMFRIILHELEPTREMLQHQIREQVAEAPDGTIVYSLFSPLDEAPVWRPLPRREFEYLIDKRRPRDLVVYVDNTRFSAMAEWRRRHADVLLPDPVLSGPGADRGSVHAPPVGPRLAPPGDDPD